MFNKVLRCMAMLRNGLQVSMLEIIIIFLEWSTTVCSRILFPSILKRKTIISSIPLCYGEYYNIANFLKGKLLNLAKSIILASSTHDALKPLGI